MNFLGINPYPRHPLGEITMQIREALMRFLDENTKIEIEFKYAELKDFFTSLKQPN